MRRAQLKTPPIAATAFTLIELMLVVAIIAIFAAMVLPRVSTTTPAFRASLAAQALAADMELLRTSARARGTSTTLTISADGSTYTLTGLARPGQSTSYNRTIRLSDGPFFSAVDPTTIPSSPITFSADGTPSQSLVFRIISKGHTKTLTLSRQSSSITIN